MTDSKLTWLRLILRNLVTVGLILALVVLPVFLVRELPPEPEPALIGLLVLAVGGLVGALGMMAKALSSNMESKNGDGGG